MAAMKPRTGDGPLEVTKEGRGYVMRVPLEGGGHQAPPALAQKVEAARRHLEMSIHWKGETLGVLETRRHYTNYFKGIPNFKPLRTRLVTSDHSEEVFAVFDEILDQFAFHEPA